MPTIERVTREEWGAAPLSRKPTSKSSTRGVTVHWLGGGRGLRDHSRCAALMRAIQRMHMRGEWYDFAYNEAVCLHGVRFEGRGYHVQCGANGTNTGNETHYAILAMMGDGDTGVTPELLAGVQDAADDYRKHAAAGDEVKGHRDWVKTECCGDELYALVKAGTFSPGATRYEGHGGMTAPISRPKPMRKLDEDGKFGPATTRAFQRALGTTVDGKISHQTRSIRDANPGLKARRNWEFDSTRRGSQAIREHQHRLRAHRLYSDRIDGLAGPNYWHAVQRFLGLDLPRGDREISDPSATVRALQRALNAGRGL